MARPAASRRCLSTRLSCFGKLGNNSECSIRWRNHSVVLGWDLLEKMADLTCGELVV